MEKTSFPTKLVLFALVCVVYGAGLCVKVMDVDAAQYASMSREIAFSGNFFRSLLQPEGYLDKPPLLFFFSALSFKLFGVSTIVYKLPSLLFTLLGLFSVKRLGTMLFDRKTGTLAMVMLCCSQAWIYFNNDVRTDAILAGSVIFSTWQLYALITTGRLRYFWGSSIGLALALLAKGPIGFMAPFCAFAAYGVVKRDIRLLFKWYWPAMAAVIIVFLLPMLWGLYGNFGVKGVTFYFWTQSFGRLTSHSPVFNNASPFFFLHTFLWAFLPWAFIAYYAFAERFLFAARQRFADTTAGEALLLGGIAFPFIALSFSRYQLPHYIFVIFPLCAIVTARTVIGILDHPERKTARGFLLYLQLGCCILGWMFALFILSVVFPGTAALPWLAIALPMALTFHFAMPGRSLFQRTVLTSIVTILGVNLMLNFWFYPSLIDYQGGCSAAQILRRHKAPLSSIYTFRVPDTHSVRFYTGTSIPDLDSAQLTAKIGRQDMWLYTSEGGYSLVRRCGARICAIDSFPDYHVTIVTPKFLFNRTRKSALTTKYVLHTVP